jgi:hypothetical protein
MQASVNPIPKSKTLDEPTRDDLEEQGMAKKSDDTPETSKGGKGAGTRSGGVSGGKHTGGTTREDKDANPRGKGSGNR